LLGAFCGHVGVTHDGIVMKGFVLEFGEFVLMKQSDLQWVGGGGGGGGYKPGGRAIHMRASTLA